ncbi:MAG: 5-formyltetrahydrofolate cyclo-ligase [Candidatus Accumulibacter sp.]|jgi:5,10-methenyltetrahydrofolate synthetase|nr:5-formyltetrahydrofolate cyclo-ligase [Accumulibacter sp.]
MPTDPSTEHKDFTDSACRAAWRSALRRDAIARRVALSQDDYAQGSRAVCRHLLANFSQLAVMRVGFYWPINREPDLRPALETWLAAGDTAFAALLPVVTDTGVALSFRRWRQDAAMAADRYGIPIPAAGEFIQPQALLIPLAAFDANGFRLGYGGGYFDRTLAQLRPRPLAIGVGFDLCRVDSIHPEAHDERLDSVVTETGVISFGGTNK